MPSQPQTRQTADGQEVLDIVRRRYVALTPEEWIRQTLIHHLHYEKGYPLELMQVEGTINMNGMSRRCDIVVYRKGMEPVMIVECKRPGVPITQKVIDQACRYNTVLEVPLLLLTNGENTVLLKVDREKGELQALAALPKWEELE